MIAKKVCMVGPFAVGKTSLVRRFVESIFDDRYLTTIGVKISKKRMSYASTDVQLMIWDIEGVDVFTELNASYLRGASGVFLVLDGTRPKSLENVEELVKLVQAQLPDVPLIGLLNKCDLSYEWKLSTSEIEALEQLGLKTRMTSAKTGEGVEESFSLLTDLMLKNMEVSS